MRTTVTLDDDVHEFATYYARGKGITLSAALNELVRQAETAPKPEPDIVIGPHGLPMFPRTDNTITSEMVSWARIQLLRFKSSAYDRIIQCSECLGAASSGLPCR